MFFWNESFNKKACSKFFNEDSWPQRQMLALLMSLVIHLGLGGALKFLNKVVGMGPEVLVDPWGVFRRYSEVLLQLGFLWVFCGFSTECYNTLWLCLLWKSLWVATHRLERLLTLAIFVMKWESFDEMFFELGWFSDLHWVSTCISHVPMCMYQLHIKLIPSGCGACSGRKWMTNLNRRLGLTLGSSEGSSHHPTGEPIPVSRMNSWVAMDQYHTKMWVGQDNRKDDFVVFWATRRTGLWPSAIGESILLRIEMYGLLYCTTAIHSDWDVPVVSLLTTGRQSSKSLRRNMSSETSTFALTDRVALLEMCAGCAATGDGNHCPSYVYGTFCPAIVRTDSKLHFASHFNHHRDENLLTSWNQFISLQTSLFTSLTMLLREVWAGLYHEDVLAGPGFAEALAHLSPFTLWLWHEPSSTLTGLKVPKNSSLLPPVVGLRIILGVNFCWWNVGLHTSVGTRYLLLW